MSVLRRCRCREPIIKTAAEPGAVVFTGTVLGYCDRIAVVCKKCGAVHDFPAAFPLALPRPTGVILPDRPRQI